MIPYYIYCVFDANYIEISYVFLASFYKTNKHHKIHIHCVNFTDEQYDTYTKNIARFENAIPVRCNFNYSLDNFVKNSDFTRMEYGSHVEVCIYKLKLMNDLDSEYSLYMDIDSIVRRPLDEILIEYPDNLNVRYYNSAIGYQPNAGFIILKKPDNNTIWEQAVEYFKIHKDISYPEETILKLCKGYTKKNISNHCHSSKHDCDSNPVFFHFYSNVKPYWLTDYEWEKDTTLYTLLPYIHEWYDVYESVSDMLTQKTKDSIASIRKRYEKYTFILDRMKKRREKLYGCSL